MLAKRKTPGFSVPDQFKTLAENPVNVNRVVDVKNGEENSPKINSKFSPKCVTPKVDDSQTVDMSLFFTPNTVSGESSMLSTTATTATTALFTLK